MAAKKKTTSKAASKSDTATKPTPKRSPHKRATTGKTATKKTTPRKAPAKPAATETTGKQMGGLDAAAKILADAKEPMTVKTIVEQAEARGLWKSRTGKTPAATISAAIGREIRDKGKESRFKKVDRGLFAATGK